MQQENPSEERCPACGGKTYVLRGRLPAPSRVMCTQPPCVVARNGVELETLRLMNSLTANHFKAGYQQALADMSGHLNALEAKSHGDRRSNRGYPPTDQGVPG